MKKIFLSVSVVLAIVISSSAQKKKDCETYKKGYYHLQSPYDEFIIKREGDKQIEIDEYGTVFIFDVKWTDNCTYMLTLEAIENEKNHPLEPDIVEGEQISVSILKSMSNGYEQITTTNMDHRNYFGKMIEINEKTFNERLDEVNYKKKQRRN